MGLSGIPVEYADGDVIFARGDSAADMYLVSEGSVEIVGWDKHGPVVLETVQPGGCFGEIAIFSPGVRSASAVARGKTIVELIDTPTLEGYIDNPAVWGICKKLSERCRRATSGKLTITDSVE